MEKNKYNKSEKTNNKQQHNTADEAVEQNATQTPGEAATEGESTDTKADAEPKEELSEVDKLKKELEETRDQLEKEKKEYLFLMADFDNFRKRTIRERSELIKNAAEKVLKDLLPIVDDFERGLEASKDAAEAKAIHDGMELIYNKLIKHLGDNGVKAMESTGADFNADIHEAIATISALDESQKGKVIDTTQKGYTINDKVLRHAKVVVAQ